MRSSIAGQIVPGGRGPAASAGPEHLEVELLPPAGVDDRHRPRLEPRVAVGRRPAQPAQVAGHLVERPLGGREADPDERAARLIASSRSSSRARKTPRLLPQSAWISSTMTCETLAERLARPAREHQVERFGRRDQDVGRLADDPLPLGGRRVAAPDRDARAAAAARLAPRPSPGSRRAAPRRLRRDVLVQRLERRDVEDPHPARRRGVPPEHGRGTPGTPPASCPSPSARRSACSAPRRSPASPAAAAASARRRSRGTNARPAAGTPPARPPARSHAPSPPGSDALDSLRLSARTRPRTTPNCTDVTRSRAMPPPRPPAAGPYPSAGRAPAGPPRPAARLPPTTATRSHASGTRSAPGPGTAAPPRTLAAGSRPSGYDTIDPGRSTHQVSSPQARTAYSLVVGSSASRTCSRTSATPAFFSTPESASSSAILRSPDSSAVQPASLVPTTSQPSRSSKLSTQGLAGPSPRPTSTLTRINAIKFTPEGGTVEIWAEYVAQRGEVTIGVTDTGSGLALKTCLLSFSDFARSIKGFTPAPRVRLRIQYCNGASVLQPGKNRCAERDRCGKHFLLHAADFHTANPSRSIHRRIGSLGESARSLFSASIDLSQRANAVPVVDEYLQRTLRANDLVVSYDEKSWIIAAVCPASDCPRMIDGYQRTGPPFSATCRRWICRRLRSNCIALARLGGIARRSSRPIWHWPIRGPKLNPQHLAEPYWLSTTIRRSANACVLVCTRPDMA